jgi:uncharacterized protein
MLPVQPGSSERTWSMLAHLTSLSLFLGIPFGHILGPLIIWLIKKDEMPAVDAHGKESLNFQLSMTLYAIGASLVVMVLTFVLIGFLLIPFLVLFLAAILVLQLACVVVAAIKTNNGEFFCYPFTIRFLI